MKKFEVIIIGGSFAGLSAAMSLGRALRKVLIIDAGNPCNIQSPSSHNLLTQDGDTPEAILSKAKKKIAQYPEITFKIDFVIKAEKLSGNFKVMTSDGDAYSSKKLIIATGVKDILPEIIGFKECWGITLLHCPYCHGYEFKNRFTGIYGDSKYVYQMAISLLQWTKNLHLFITDSNNLNSVQKKSLRHYNIQIYNSDIVKINHKQGYIKSVKLDNGQTYNLSAIYIRSKIRQNILLDQSLNYKLTDKGLIEVDILQKTTQEGIFACGDNATHGRSIAMAISTGSLAGIMCNKELIEESLKSLHLQLSSSE